MPAEIAHRPQVAVTNPIHDEIARMLADTCDLRVNGDHANPWDHANILDQAPEAQALMTFMTDRVDADFLDRLPNLKIIACALKGYDSFDVDACTDRGIWLTIVPDLLTTPTAELAIGLAIGVMRHVMAGDTHIRSGGFTGWRPSLYGMGLAGANIGILGLGRVGLAVAERLSGFGACLYGSDAAPLAPRIARNLGLEEISAERLAETCDVTFVCLPLNEATRHMVDTAFIRRMKPGTFLVNPGRGSVVDETAVTEALATRHLAGYAADVFEMEDWSLDDRPREIPSALLAMKDRTLFTPHLGSAVKDVRIEIERSAATSILQALAGERPDCAINDLINKKRA
ncbi:MAG: NAD(P)-dependent oxidoreductase [Rhodospirillales bacterium]